MIKTLTNYRIAKIFFLLNAIFFLLSLCIVNISSAEQQEAGEFPWEIFYPAIIKKSVDKDKDGFTKEQGDCNDSDPGINPDATEICGDEIDQDCDGYDLLCFPDIRGVYTGSYTTTLTNCSIAGTYQRSIFITISSQTESKFSGLAESTDNINHSATIIINGTISTSGQINGDTSTKSYTDGVLTSTSEGIFTGQLTGDYLTYNETGHFTSGPDCGYSKQVSAAR